MYHTTVEIMGDSAILVRLEIEGQEIAHFGSSEFSWYRGKKTISTIGIIIRIFTF